MFASIILCVIVDILGNVDPNSYPFQNSKMHVYMCFYLFNVEVSYTGDFFYGQTYTWLYIYQLISPSLNTFLSRMELLGDEASSFP